MSPTVSIVLHDPGAETRPLEEVLGEHGIVSRIHRLHAGEPAPELDELVGLIVLGGAMGTYEADRYPFLNESMRLLDRAIQRDLPTLAICLGAQLLARVAGANVFRGHAGREWGFVPIAVTETGRADPVLGAIAGEHFSFHSDSFELPGAIDLLAESPTYPQAFRVGSALGLQFHPELSVTGMHKLLALLDREVTTEAVQRARIDASKRQAATRRTLITLLSRWVAPAPEPTDDRHDSWRSG